MSVRAPVNPRTMLTWLGLAAGVVGLGLQFYLSMQAYAAIGKDIPGALGTFFAFYTILANIVLVLIYLSHVTTLPQLKLFRCPVVRGAMAANIALVMLYVYFVLRFLVPALEGDAARADSLLHYMAPIFYILWWLAAQPHGALKWSNLPIMLAPTVGYFVYILARGAWVHEYPYPILNVDKLGYGPVFLNAIYMTIAFAALSALVIVIDQFIARQSRTAAP